MASLVLSRRDVDFILFEWLKVQSLIERDRFADHSRETFGAALDTYQSIAHDFFAPHNKKNDQNEPHFDGQRVTVNPEAAAAIKAFSEAGLMAARQEYGLGGMQLPCVVERAGMAYMMAANISTAAFAFLTIANAELLLAYGSAAQIERFVRPMMEGRFFGTMCLSEPQAGSSLADIRTRAERREDGSYRLAGNKMWISGGEHEVSANIIHLVLAKIPDQEGKLSPGVQGISLFLVPKYLVKDDGSLGERNDVVLAGLNHKMGYRGIPNCLLNFGEGKHRPNGEPGAIGYLIGEPGKGLACMFKMMNEARIAVGLGAAALGYTGYLHALDYARSRPQGRLPAEKRPEQAQVPIIAHPDVRRMLLAQKAYAEGALALAMYSARLVDEQQTAESAEDRINAERLLDLLTPVTKSWPSQWCLEGNNLAIQVHGGYGYTREYNVEQFYRDNRLNPIHEGTFGIQALDLLGRKVRLHDGQSMRLLDKRIRNTVERASGYKGLRPHGEELVSAWTAVSRVCQALYAVPDVTARLANAGIFLEAFGHVVLAWIWLDQAVAAMKALGESAGGEDGNFYSGKLQTCRYFYYWELPKAAAWLQLLDPIERTCLEMKEEWF